MSEGDVNPQISELQALVGYHLRRAGNLFAADFTREMDDIGIRQVLFGILSVVNANPGINQGSVGRSLGIQRANMVALINELVDRELVDRQVSSEDRRAFSLSLTDKGQALYESCLVRIRAHEERLLKKLDARDRQKLIQLLSAISHEAE